MIFEKLKNLRENNDLTQRQIALKLNVSKSTYNRWETGETFIPLKHLNNLCNFYNLSMDYIVSLSNNKNYDNVKNEINKKIIGKRIFYLRKKFNLSQNDLAKLLNTSHSTISAYENGKTLILTVFAYSIATKFNVSLDWLCGRIDKKNY